MILELGFPSERADVIHAFIGGSTLHGIKLEGTDDIDVYGIYIERPWLVLGLDGMEHFVASTAPQTRRNTAHDVDAMCYSLRKWARLAAAGNPTLLHSLFTPAVPGEIEWSMILEHRDIFLARAHAKKYLGYADAQLKRMTGLRGEGKHGQRPEIIQQFGYDTKAAMHTLRLLYEGIELMRKGRVTLPRATEERELLLAVRRGEWSEERVVQHAKGLFRELEESAAASCLPETVDRSRISKLVADLYLQNWWKAGV
jgi:predicted nucleotidyltransferase